VQARPALVAVFFGSYVILIFLICLNVIIAIISEGCGWVGGSCA
jgi:hypothetical protein